jgi:hypothetical protein
MASQLERERLLKEQAMKQPEGLDPRAAPQEEVDRYAELGVLEA